MLRVDWCSHEAAKYAVLQWHYSEAMPAGKIMKLGVWEDDQFIGAILYSRGANKHIGRPYDLTQYGCCELTRIAMRKHVAPVTQALAISLKMIRERSPGVRLVVSYADSKQGHLGIIYQASNWIYTGSDAQAYLYFNNKLWHPRTVYSRYGQQGKKWLRENVDPKADWVMQPEKHKYLMPLDKAMRRAIMHLAQPYPKSGRGRNGNTSGFQPEEAGSIPAVRS